MYNGDIRKNGDKYEIYWNAFWHDYEKVKNSIFKIEKGVQKYTIDISGPEWDKFREGLVVDE